MILKIPPRQRNIKAVLFDSDAIMDLLLICDAIKRTGGSIGKLTIPYIPYGRQDRAINAGEPNGIYVMSKLINSIGAKTVETLDPHSMVTEALIDNLVVVTQRDLIADVFEKTLVGQYKGGVVVAPDAGAEKKSLHVAQVLDASLETASKRRNVKTGSIEKTIFNSSQDLNGKHVLIVDDICDGGATFKFLSDEILSQYKPERLGLYVTHGIFSKGVDELGKVFDHIYTVDYSGPDEYKAVLIEGKTTGEVQ